MQRVIIEIGADGNVRVEIPLSSAKALGLSAEKMETATTVVEPAKAPVAPQASGVQKQKRAVFGPLNGQPVQLDPKDPEFSKQVAELKKQGYVFDRNTKTWYFKKTPAAADPTKFERWWGDEIEVTLSKDDPDFQGKKAALKAAGFTWHNESKSWLLLDDGPF